MEFITSIQVCLISQVDINYKENSGEKYPDKENLIVGAHNKINKNYCEYLSLSYFSDGH